jgi:hypothetical protein
MQHAVSMWVVGPRCLLGLARERVCLVAGRSLPLSRTTVGEREDSDLLLLIRLQVLVTGVTTLADTWCIPPEPRPAEACLSGATQARCTSEGR